MGSMYLIIIAISCGFAAGYCAQVIGAWSQRRFLVELDYRVAELEERVTREVKKRAQIVSTEKQNEERDLLSWAKNQRQGENNTVSVPSYRDWYQKKMIQN